MIAAENSNVHLPLLKLGIPTVAVKGLGLYPRSRSDLYGFIEHGVVFPPVESIRDVRADDVHCVLLGLLGHAVQGIRRSYLLPPGAIENEVRRAIQQLLSTRPWRRHEFRGRSHRRHPHSIRGRKRGALLSLLVSGGLIYLLYRTLNLRQVGEALLTADRLWLVISIGMILPITALRAIRFFWVAPAGALPGIGEAFKLTLVSSALNVFVPAKAGDLIKSYFVAKRGHTTTGVAIAIIVYERLCDMFGLIFWCLLGWFVGRPEVTSLPAAFWLLLGGLGALCGILISSEWAAAVWRAVMMRLIPDGKLRKLRQLAVGWPDLLEVLRSRRQWIVPFSLLLWFAHLFQIWLFTVALSLHVPFTVCASLSADCAHGRSAAAHRGRPWHTRCGAGGAARTVHGTRVGGRDGRADLDS